MSEVIAPVNVIGDSAIGVASTVTSGETVTPVTVIGSSAIGGSASVDSGDIAVVAGNLSAIDIVSNNIASVVTDANNITSINTVAASNTQVVNVSDNMTKVQTVYDKLGELNRYYTTFLGTSATDPTLRLDGSAVQTGDLYYSTSMPGMKVKTASGWEAAGSGISGTFKFSAGSAAAPSITTFGDEDTGVYFPAANTTALTTNGVERLRIGPTGTVTIGGEISATGGLTGNVTGNASTATALATGRTIGMTGDVSYTSAAFNGSANVTGTATLATTGVTAGSYGSVDSATSTNRIPTITVDAKGRITNIGTGVIYKVPVAGVADYAQELGTGRTIGMTGDVSYTSGSFSGAANVTGTATLATTGVTAGSYGSTSAIPSITVDAKGRVTSISNNAITVAAGAVGGGTDRIFWENDKVVTTSYTLTSNKNAVTAGPITVNTGVTVTIPTGGVWTVV